MVMALKPLGASLFHDGKCPAPHCALPSADPKKLNISNEAWKNMERSLKMSRTCCTGCWAANNRLDKVLGFEEVHGGKCAFVQAQQALRAAGSSENESLELIQRVREEYERKMEARELAWRDQRAADIQT